MIITTIILTWINVSESYICYSNQWQQNKVNIFRYRNKSEREKTFEMIQNRGITLCLGITTVNDD